MYHRARAINQLKQCVFRQIALLGQSDSFLDPQGCHFTSADGSWLMILPPQLDGSSAKQYAIGHDGRLYCRQNHQWLPEDLDQQVDQVWQEVAHAILLAFADSRQRQPEIYHYHTDIISGEVHRMISID